MIESFTGKTMTGREFNDLIGSEPMIKFTTESENHNGFQLRTGLNVDTQPFYNKHSCHCGGIYFTSLYYFHTWVVYSNKRCVQFRYVTVPDDARVYIESHKFKADKIIMSEARPLNSISTLWEESKYALNGINSQNIVYMMQEKFNMPELYYMNTMKNRPGYVRYVPNKFLSKKDFRMKLYDVNSLIFKQLTKYRDSDEVLTVMTKSPGIYGELSIDEKLNPAIYTTGLAYDPRMIRAIPKDKQTLDICRYAFSQSPAVFTQLAHHEPDMYEPALSFSGLNLQLIHRTEQTEELIMTAVQNNGIALKHAAFQTHAIAYEAVKQTGEAYQFVENQRPLTIIREADGTITQEYDDSLINLAVKTWPPAIKIMKTFNEEAIVTALTKDHTLFKNLYTNHCDWVTSSMKMLLFRKDLKEGFKYYPKFQVDDSIIMNAITADRKNAYEIPSTYKYSTDMAEYILNEFPDLRSRVLDYLPRSAHESIVKDDILESLFSDTSLDVAEQMLADGTI